VFWHPIDDNKGGFGPGRNLVTQIVYASGDEVRPGDEILYQGESGVVDFVVGDEIGNPALDWYLKEFPGGGVMITARGFGSVFVATHSIPEHLEFVSRDDDSPTDKPSVV
jgi:hypothetical protein